MATAHVFQHNYTGIQIFVYHVEDRFRASVKISASGIDVSEYTYLGTKTVIS